MTATSVTGRGRGASNKYTTKELSAIANGPAIFVAGTIESVERETSPPSFGNEVVFPSSLPGGPDSYVVMLTSISGGYAYVISMNDDEENNFTGFEFDSESECDMMYLVVKKGYRPSI